MLLFFSCDVIFSCPRLGCSLVHQWNYIWPENTRPVKKRKQNKRKNMKAFIVNMSVEPKNRRNSFYLASDKQKGLFPSLRLPEKPQEMLLLKKTQSNEVLYSSKHIFLMIKCLLCIGAFTTTIDVCLPKISSPTLLNKRHVSFKV